MHCRKRDIARQFAHEEYYYDSHQIALKRGPSSTLVKH